VRGESEETAKPSVFRADVEPAGLKLSARFARLNVLGDLGGSITMAGQERGGDQFSLCALCVFSAFSAVDLLAPPFHTSKLTIPHRIYGDLTVLPPGTPP
jgi:hypothetical protein